MSDKLTSQRILRAMEDLIQLVRAVESREGERCGQMSADLDVVTQGGKKERWTITVEREEYQACCNECLENCSSDCDCWCHGSTNK